jgi:hypothetical protein
VPVAVQQALEAWLKVHPLARRVGLLDEQPLFVRLGRHGDQEPLSLSAVAVHRLVRRHCLGAGVAERLARPHALRAYWATHLLEAASPCTRSPLGSGTSTCAPLPATPPRGPSGSMRLPRSWIADIRPRGGRVGGRSSTLARGARPYQQACSERRRKSGGGAGDRVVCRMESRDTALSVPEPTIAFAAREERRALRVAWRVVLSTERHRRLLVVYQGGAQPVCVPDYGATGIAGGSLERSNVASRMTTRLCPVLAPL